MVGLGQVAMTKKRTDLDGLAIYYNGKTPEQWYSLYCQQLKIEDAATAVLHAASRGDQQFVDCLRGDGEDRAKLRYALADLHDALRKD